MHTPASTRPPSRAATLLSVLSVWSLLAQPAQGAQRAVDPCAVLTTAAVEQAIGKLKRPPSPGNDGGVPWCGYESANGKDAMEVWVFPAGGLDRARKLSKNPVPVAGLGEGALMERGAHGLGYLDLYVKKGGVTVKLSLKEMAGDEPKLRALAQKALGRF